MPAWRPQFDIGTQFPPSDFVFVTIIIMRQHFATHRHGRHGLLADFPCGILAFADFDHQLGKSMVQGQRQTAGLNAQHRRTQHDRVRVNRLFHQSAHGQMPAHAMCHDDKRAGIFLFPSAPKKPQIRNPSAEIIDMTHLRVSQ